MQKGPREVNIHIYICMWIKQANGSLESAPKLWISFELMDQIGLVVMRGGLNFPY